MRQIALGDLVLRVGFLRGNEQGLENEAVEQGLGDLAHAEVVRRGHDAVDAGGHILHTEDERAFVERGQQRAQGVIIGVEDLVDEAELALDKRVFGVVLDAALLEFLDVETAEIGVGLLLFRGLHLEDVRAVEHAEDLLRQQRFRRAGAALDQRVFAHEHRRENLVDDFRAVDDATVDEGDRSAETVDDLVGMKRSLLLCHDPRLAGGNIGKRKHTP